MDLAIYLGRTSTTPLYQQLTDKIRSAILARSLQPDRKLPSSQSLAKLLAISRSTVTQSYEQLESEGYLETRCGSGTYVCHQIPDEWLNSRPIEPVTDKIAKDLILSQFGRSLDRIGSLQVDKPSTDISFCYGDPATDYFPIKQWRKLLTRHCNQSSALLGYDTDATGHLPLRVEIANYLQRSRAVRCSPDRVIVVNGSQQALDLISRLTLDPEDWVALEEPGYLGARYCFTGQSAYLEPIPVDSEGLDVDFLNQCNRSFKLIYVTPSHQFPTGVTLTLSRRIALLQWAQATGTLIIEDDYDSEYRYGEQPIPALQGMDKSQSIIYIGTFSKTMFPSLRIGYLVVPQSWVSSIGRAKWLCDRTVPLLQQQTLTDWIAEGYFERHIRRMRQLYNLRRQVLIAALKKYFGERITILGANAGIHLMVRIETNLSDRLIIEKAAAIGVGLVSAAKYYLEPKQDRGEFILGYARLDEAQIERGVLKLARVFKDDKSS